MIMDGVGSKAIINSGKAGTGTFVPLVFHTSDTERMRIDASGNISTPHQPAFHAKSGQETASGSDVGGYTSVFNRGNHLNVTNGRFTAPVAGVYFFRYQQLAKNADSGEYRTALYKNGAAYGGLRFITQKPADTWWSLFAEGHVYMDAGDYVTVRYESGPNTLYSDNNYGSFSGHFVG
jgi:hypothetical protein